MAQKTLAYLKALWIRGYKPLEQDFVDFFDSFWHKSESIPQAKVTGLVTALNEKEFKFDFVDDVFSTVPVIGAIGSTGATISFTNQLKHIPLVFVNGIRYRVGTSSVPSENICFFGPTASTVRGGLNEIISGDLLFWNPLFANSFDLTASDEIILNYIKR
jgi:hypothetical protein